MSSKLVKLTCLGTRLWSKRNLIILIISILGLILLLGHSRQGKNEEKVACKNGPTIFAITPTHARSMQKAELIRIAQTFLHVPNFYWVVVEDSNEKTEMVTNFLRESGLNYQHLNVISPSTSKLKKQDSKPANVCGVVQRNAGLNWLRKTYNTSKNDIVYFVDDDNTYSLKLFNEMEKIKVIGVWPVAFVGMLTVERPICDRITNKVIDFNAAWRPKRSFPIDMAGFAINLKVILKKENALFSYFHKQSDLESQFLEQLVTRDDLEPLADFCTKVYVWRTRANPPALELKEHLKKTAKIPNDNIEF